MIKKIKITIIDDDEDDFILTEDILNDIEGLEVDVHWENDFEIAKNKLISCESDIYLIDYRLGKLSGLDLLEYARTNFCNKPIIILTGQGDREIDMLAMKMGADDYIIKSEINKTKLERSIRYALERFMATEKLNHEEAKYRGLFQRSIDPIYIIDKDFNCLECNPSLINLFGYQEDEIGNKNLSLLFNDQAEFDEFKSSLIQKGLIKNKEVKLVRKDGKKLSCAITTIVLFNINHEIEGYQGIIRDNTAQKENEKQILRAEKLGMTGRLARSIAHEVRNPLTNINLALEQMISEMDKEADEMVYAHIIERNSERINNLITELLNSAKPTKVNLDDLLIDEIIPKVIDLAADRIQLKDIKLTSHLNCPDVRLNIDEKQLITALLNIVINAIEAMPEENGELEVKTYCEDDMIFITIEDNGEGMNQEKLDNLFDAFYTGKRSGMGLGLTTTQNIINAHNAKIEVESEEGVGTKFTIKFNLK